MNKTKITLGVAAVASLALGCAPDDGVAVLDQTVDDTSCTVERDDDGTTKIQCPDGSKVTIEQGEDGADGHDGEDGDSAKNGRDGEVGNDGDPGNDGKPGEDGAKGEDGKDGEPGKDGEAGLQGVEGSPGLDGAEGDDGQDGDAGKAGEAGKKCSVECVDDQTAKISCEDGSEIRYQVESCKMPPQNLLSARGQHACWILPGDSRLVCWGNDANGVLGNGGLKGDQARGNLVDTRKQEHALDTRWRSVDIGSHRSCGITVSGDAYCWGSLLNVFASQVPVPVDISDLPQGTTWSVISTGVGQDFTCGVSSVGTAYCWGSDARGALGNGPSLTQTQLTPSPVDVDLLTPETTWSTISVGRFHVCGLTTDGNLFCWGEDSTGSLGNGADITDAQTSPSLIDVAAVPPETSWAAVSAGFAHTCALTAEGKAYCWGSDDNGQLGNGNLGAASSPSPVDTSLLPAGVGFAQLSAGERHTCGIDNDGSAWCWGNGASGRLGDGTSTGNAPSPVAVDVSLLPPGTTWKSLSAGVESTCGLTNKDEVYCWGADTRGQLGIGSSLRVSQLRPGSSVQASIGVLVDHAQYQGEFSGAIGIDSPKLPLTVLSLNGSSEELTVTATSGDATILPSDNIAVTGTGRHRFLSFEPIASGLVMITVVVSSSEGEYSFRFEYGGSPQPSDPMGIYYHHISDASTAIDAGDGYVLLADDEVNLLFLYQKDSSGLPIKVWDFTSEELLRHNELDIEGAARSGDTIVWTSSHANSSKSGENEPRRRAIFATKITGAGADVELSFSGRYGGGPVSRDEAAKLGLWTDLIAWDKANGHGLGADALGFEAATLPGVFPFAPSGFGIEALEFAADGTTGYLGFRAPTIDVEGSPHALIVPVPNILDLVDGISEQVGRGQFGSPIFLDLAGRSIREMRRNESGEYLISAGPPENATAGENDTWALYTWAGVGQPAVFNRELPDVDGTTGGTWESIATVPNPLQSGATVRLVTDSGNTVMYGGEETKDALVGHQKSYSQLFSLE